MTLNNNIKYKIIVWGLLVHFLLLFAVFDVYFSSPLDKGMTPVKSTESPSAKRLVLFVADGLRAEAVFEEDEGYRIPFLSALKQSGSWGIVHTRVPTESRPGHVAMLAGIYEDPSAIFKGWKANPVAFDSIISQSTNSWCWGSPDIINLFNKNELPTVHLDSYGSEMEDFGKNKTGILDTWVYNKVEKFLNEIYLCRFRRNETCKEYSKGGNFFFLHLLGIDTAGHGYKPHSKEYITNIKLVDEIVRNTTELFEAAFSDQSTAYVFTSDHGMTDWGSHGSGSRHETEVPIIAWGAGIKSTDQRQDINQIDIAPLLSSLIGINIPVNSLGIVPINYLDLSEEKLTKIMLSNTKQLLEIFNIKKMRIHNNALVVLPFKYFTSKSVNAILYHLKKLTIKKKFKDLIPYFKDFMNRLVQGVNYYHNYYQYPVLISITVGFLSWIIFLSISIFDHDTKNKSKHLGSSKKYRKMLTIAIILVALLCFKHELPLTYYLYFSFPVIMSFIVLNSLKVNYVFRNLPSVEIKNTFVNVVFYLIGLELLIYGFFDRTAFTILMLLVGVWIFASKNLNSTTSKKEKLIWISCCFTLAVFPSLPVMKTSFNIPMYVLGFVGWVFLFRQMYVNKVKYYYQLKSVSIQYKAFSVQFCCLIMAAIYVLLLEYDYISNDSNLKYVSWLFLVIPILMIPLTSTFIAVRLIATFFAFAPFYLLVSPNYEVIFSVFYVALLCSWLLTESKSFHFGKTNIIYYVKFESYKSKTNINSDCFRRAFLFMVFIFLGFFGTGNIASLNSFDPMWVRAFVTVFSPFKMTGLILLKLTVPFIFTCCVFRAINLVGKESILKTFCIILIFSDVMLLQFVYLITNVGSWLDIGTSLSHFIIMEAFVIILLLLYGLAHLLTTVTYSF